jgi:hypothetical protein
MKISFYEMDKVGMDATISVWLEIRVESNSEPDTYNF